VRCRGKSGHPTSHGNWVSTISYAKHERHQKDMAFFANVIWITALVGITCYLFFWIAPEMRRRNIEKRAELRNEIEFIKPHAEMGDADSQYRLATIIRLHRGWGGDRLTRKHMLGLSKLHRVVM